MFGGQWKETDESCISIDILDSNIDEDGMYLYAVHSCHYVMLNFVELRYFYRYLSPQQSAKLLQNMRFCAVFPCFHAIMSSEIVSSSTLLFK